MVYANYVRERMKTLPKYAEAEGNPIVIDNCLKRPFKAINITAEGEAVENPTVKVAGKNLFDINNVKLAAAGAWAYDFSPKIENGVLYNGGVASDTSGAHCCVYCGKNPCTLSLTIEGCSGKYYEYINVIQLDGITEKGYFINSANLTTRRNLKDGRCSITLKPTKDYIGFALTDDAAKHIIKATDIQIELGDTATEYEPYKEEQEVVFDGVLLADGDSISHNGRKVVTNIEEVEADITDTEEGKKFLALHTNKGTTNVFLNSDSGEGSLLVKYQRK